MMARSLLSMVILISSKDMKKAASMIWLIISLFVMPCVLNPEHMGALLFIMVNMAASFLVNRKVNPEIFVQ